MDASDTKVPFLVFPFDGYAREKFWSWEARFPLESLYQVWQLTQVRLRARYRGTFAGVLWVAISPISLFLVEFFIFGQLLQPAMPNYFLFLLSGVFPWFFIAQCVDMGASLILTNGTLLKSLQLHPGILMGALILDNFVSFIGTMWLTAGVYFLLGYGFHWSVLLSVFPALLLAVWVFAATSLIALVNVFLKDTRYVVTFALQVLFFLTPVFYPATINLPLIRAVADINPMSLLLAPFRYCLFAYDPRLFLAAISRAGIFTLVMSAVAYQFWRVTKNDIYFRI